jgi:5-methylcytosine-specific restriction endonuclease McrA
VDISDLQYKAKVCSKRCHAIARGLVRAEPLPAIDCVICGTSFTPRGASSKYCSPGCRNKRPNNYGPEALGRRQQRDRLKRKNSQRYTNLVSEPYTLAEIAARDRYRCGLCRRKVNMRLSGSDPQGPTIDHVIPLLISRDDTRANVQLAHRTCNIAKGARSGGEQLALIG